MFRASTIIGAAIVVAVSATAAFGQTVSNPQECVENYQAGTDLFANRVVPRHSGGWTLTYHGNYKVATVRSARDAASPEFRYVLVQCGTPAPELTGELADARVFEIPSRRVTMDLTPVPLEILGVLDRLKGWDTQEMGRNNIYTNRVIATAESVPVGDISSDGIFNVEQLLAADLDTLFLYWQYGEFPKQTDEYDLPTIWDAHGFETDALARAEWLKFFSAFYNLEAVGNARFDEVEATMAAMRERTASVKLDIGVAYLGFNEDFIWAPTNARSDVSLLLSLGPHNVLAPQFEGVTTEGTPIGYEAALAAIGPDDVLFFYWNTKSELDTFLANDDRYKTLAPFTRPDPRIYVQRERDTVDADCYGLVIYRPDIQLRDFAIALAPEQFPGEAQTCYEKYEYRP